MPPVLSRSRGAYFFLIRKSSGFLPLASTGQRGEPARLLAAAGPGFLGVGRVAVFRRHFAEFAACARTGLGALGRTTGGCAEQLLHRIAFGLDELGDLAAHRRDGRALGQLVLLLLGLGDQGAELLGGKVTQVNRHQFLQS